MPAINTSKAMGLEETSVRTLWCGGLVAALLLSVGEGLRAQGNPPPGVAYLFTLDLGGTPLDEFPSAVKALNGVMTVVDKDGQHMLKASSPSEFLLTLSQNLPAAFTVEVDLIPKSCCAPDDFMLEGTATMNRGPASVQLTWQPERISAVGGGGEMYQAAMPEDLAAATPGNLTHLALEFNGTTIKLYTNGRRLYTLDKQFARGRVLRVWLGGGTETNAVYLAGFRVRAGVGGAGGIAANAGLPSVDQPSNPLPTVTPTPPATESQSQQLIGPTPATMTMAPKVTLGSAGPVVQWTAISGVKGYTVRRWKIDDATCCNTASGPEQAVSPWQDAALLVTGTYVYEVQASLNTGATVAEQTQFTVMTPLPSSTPSLPVPGPLPSTAPTGSTAPVVSSPIAVQSGTPVRTASAPPPGSGAAAALATGPAPTVTVTGTPTTATVTWNPVPGATQYVVNRAPLGTTAWTAVTPTPITTTTSPVDILPDFRQSYTYQVLAYQANGLFGAASVDYVPPKPSDPSGFVGTVSGTTSVKLTWQAAPWAAEYLVSGPGIPLSTSVTGTSYTVSAAPYGTNVYQVASVFRPGGILTLQTAWPAVSVAVSPPIPSSPGGVAGSGSTSGTSGSSGTCGCTKTGPFAAPEFKKITGAGLQGSFTHPTDGTFTVTAQSLYGRVMLDVRDSQNQSVLSVDNPPAWGLSPDSRYFVVVATPASTNAGAAVSVYRVARGPAKWPQIIGTMAYGDGQWGFSPEGLIFIVTRYQNTKQFSLEAYNLSSSTPASGALQLQELVYGPTVTVSPCGDRLMYARWTQLPSQVSSQEGGANFYRRSSFGSTPVRTLWDHVAQTMSASITGTAASGFLVQLEGLKTEGSSQTSFPSTQCSP
jgi:hypothetical protein